MAFWNKNIFESARPSPEESLSMLRKQLDDAEMERHNLELHIAGGVTTPADGELLDRWDKKIEFLNAQIADFENERKAA